LKVLQQIDRLQMVRKKLSRAPNGKAIINSTPCSRIARRHGNMAAISPITPNSIALTWDKYDIGEFCNNNGKNFI